MLFFSLVFFSFGKNKKPTNSSQSLLSKLEAFGKIMTQQPCTGKELAQRMIGDLCHFPISVLLSFLKQPYLEKNKIH